MEASVDAKVVEVDAAGPIRTSCVKPRITIETTMTPAATSPGKAYLQGKAMGGGVAASRRTVSITAATNPDEGTISGSFDKMRSSSLSFIRFPPCAENRSAREVSAVESHVRETVLP